MVKCVSSSVNCEVQSVQCRLLSVQCAVQSVQCKVFRVNSPMQSMQYRVCSLDNIIIYKIIYLVLFCVLSMHSVCSVECAVKSVQGKQYNVQCRMSEVTGNKFQSKPRISLCRRGQARNRDAKMYELVNNVNVNFSQLG